MTKATSSIQLNLSVNGRQVSRQIEVRKHLADFVREDLCLTGTHLGCEHGVCGACGIVVDGLVVRGCLTLAAKNEGKDVQTIEGLAEAGKLSDLQRAFSRHNAAQCGFCTSGMLLSAFELCRDKPSADREQIREFLSGNICRCTGYQAIIDAVEEVLRGAEVEA